MVFPGRRFAALSFPALVVVAACGGSDSAPADEPAPEPAVQQAALPDPTTPSVWQYLQANDYQSWELWPEKGELYSGQEPHGLLLTTYLNDIAMEALAAGAGSMPAGAILVKENYMPDSTLAAVTVMYKSPGFDAANNDWWWLKRLPDGTIEAEGQGAGCIACHGGVRANDFVWTGSLSGG